MKKVFNKVLKVILICLMVLGTININIASSYAETTTNTDKFPMDNTVTYKGKITYGSNTVGDFMVNGKQAFCMAHPITTPGNGIKSVSYTHLHNIKLLIGARLQIQKKNLIR